MDSRRILGPSLPMRGVSDDGTVSDRLSPEAAFELLSNRTRLGILRVLWEADNPTAFTDLRRAVGVDDSGQFNYHLDRLVGSYVREVEAGYELTVAGEYLIGAILADAIDQRPGFGSFPVDGTCRDCGGGLEAEFEDLGVIRCSECGETVMTDAFPPTGELNRTPEEIVDAFDQWLRHRAVIAWRGVCPRCAARIISEYVLPDDGTGVRVEYACEHCGHEGAGPLVAQLLHHPAVISAYYKRGIDLEGLRYWEQRHLLDDFEEEVLEREPLRVRVTIPFDDGRLALTVDGAGDVVAIEGP